MFKRFTILNFILFLSFCSCKTDSSNSDNASSKTDHTNVILIYMDDMGFGDLSSFGHPTIQTPNIDRLAREGQKWTNFYTASSVCSPSRGALLTGRYPCRIGLCGPKQRVFFPKSIGGLPSNEITIAEMLKEKGYQTGIVGKWHLGHLPEYLPTAQGFDYYYGIPYSNDMNGVNWSLKTFFSEPDINMWDVPLMENEKIIERPANQHTITKRYTEKAVDFIEKNQDEPFFLYFPHTMVHTPLFAGEEFLDTSPRGFYGDVMNEVDWSVGEVIATLERLNLDKNTLVIFSSDNGPWLMMLEQGGSAGLLKNGKGTTWEGGMRVPGIFYMPGTILEETITGIGSTLDILPTIAAFTGATVPKDRIIDGYDLSLVLEKGAPSPRDHFFYYRKCDIYAARKEEYKVHYITEDCYKKDNNKIVLEKPILFDINQDPSEKYDHAEDHPDVLKQMEDLIANHKKGVITLTPEMDRYPEGVKPF